MTNDESNRAAIVTGPTQPKQAADIRDRWWWVETFGMDQTHADPARTKASRQRYGTDSGQGAFGA